MGKLEKIIDRLQKGSGTITYQELIFILQKFNYRLQTPGKTSGSRVAFFNSELNDLIRLLRPHPGNELKDYQVKLVKAHLAQNKLI